MTSLQRAELKQLIDAYHAAEAESWAEARVAYGKLQKWVEDTLGTDFWDDCTMLQLEDLTKE